MIIKNQAILNNGSDSVTKISAIFNNHLGGEFVVAITTTIEPNVGGRLGVLSFQFISRTFKLSRQFCAPTIKTLWSDGVYMSYRGNTVGADYWSWGVAGGFNVYDVEKVQNTTIKAFTFSRHNDLHRFNYINEKRGYPLMYVSISIREKLFKYPLFNYFNSTPVYGGCLESLSASALNLCNKVYITLRCIGVYITLQRERKNETVGDKMSNEKTDSASTLWDVVGQVNKNFPSRASTVAELNQSVLDIQTVLVTFHLRW